MSTPLQPLQNAFDAGRTLAPAAVGTQVLIMLSLSTISLVLFNILRPRNKIVYEPKSKYHAPDKAPPRISDKFCGWLPPLIHTKEPELLDKLGLDAVAFLRFLRLMRGIFAGIALLTCCILIPINYLYNRAHVKPKKRDALSMLTLRDVRGASLYAHVAVSYLITILVLVFIYVHGRAMVKLRNQWFRSPEYMSSFYARTLSVTNIPRHLQQDGGLNEILGKSLPYPVTSVHLARTVGDLPQLIEYHNQTVRDFEAVLVKYLKGGVHNKSRPVVTFGGICGIGVVRRDAIEYYTEKLKKTEAAVEQYRSRIDARKPENYGFASLAAVPYAHIVAKNLAGKHPRGATVTLAPNPKDIIWTNMTKSRRSLGCKRMIGCGWLSVICFLSLIPLLLVAALANLDGVTAAGYLPFLQSWSGNSSATFAIVSGVVPPAVSGLFTVFLPRIMRWLGKYQGALTHASLDRAVVARYFAFLVISQLIVFTLISVILNSVTELVELIGKHASAAAIVANLDKLPGRINRTYINTSTYWLKFFPLRGFLVFFDLAQVMNLLWISFKTRVFGRTPRDIREWTQPPPFEYAIYYSNLLFMAAVGLMFAPLVPLVSLAAAIVFWISSWIYKYQLMFVFVTKVETGGRLWNVVVNRVLFCVFLMQCLMVLTIGLQISFRSVKMILAIPPMLMLVVFKFFMDRKFNKTFHFYLPNEQELHAAHVHSTRADTVKNKLQNRFGHPSLHTELFTPMVHADQMHLLRQIYGGKIEEETDKGSARKGHVEILDGLRITAIGQTELQYDPVLYSRDRGEYAYDTDRYSLGSTLQLGSSRVSQYNEFGSPSVLTSSSGDYRPHSMSLSHSYFDSMLPEVARQHQPLLMHTQDSYVLPHRMPVGAGYETQQYPMLVPNRQSLRPTSATPHAASYLSPEHGSQHHSVSVDSQDSILLQASPVPHTRYESHLHSVPSLSHLEQSPPSRMYPQSSQRQDVGNSSQCTITAGQRPTAHQDQATHPSIEEVARRRTSAGPQILFQFGAPAPDVGGSTFTEGQVPFVEPRYDV